MTPRRTLNVTIPPPLLDAAERAARTQNLPLADFLRGAILSAATDARPSAGVSRRSAADLARVFDDALGWLDLQRRLRMRGFVLRRTAGGILWLHLWPQDHPLLPVSALGLSLEGLSLQFRAAFPGHMPFETASQRAGHDPAQSTALRG